MIFKYIKIGERPQCHMTRSLGFYLTKWKCSLVEKKKYELLKIQLNQINDFICFGATKKTMNVVFPFLNCLLVSVTYNHRLNDVDLWRRPNKLIVCESRAINLSDDNVHGWDGETWTIQWRTFDVTFSFFSLLHTSFHSTVLCWAIEICAHITCMRHDENICVSIDDMLFLSRSLTTE